MLRVLLVSEPGNAGVFRHVETLARWLMRRGMVPDLAYSSRRGSDRLVRLVQEITDAGGHTLDLKTSNAPQPADGPAMIALHAFVRRRRPDVIHAHSSKAGALARALPLLGLRIPLLYTAHGYYGLTGRRGLKSTFYNAVEAILGRIGRSITLCQAETELAASTLRIPRTRLHLVRNPVDATHFQPADAATRLEKRHELGVADDTLLLGWVGRLAPQKDPQTLLRAFADHAVPPNVKLYLLGEGEMEAECTALVNQLGIGHRIIRRGYMTDPLPFYQTLDGLISTSAYEGCPYSLLEALACDLPLLVSEAPGNIDFTTFGLSHCWSAPTADASAMAQRIAAWAADLRSKRPSNHRDIALRQFSEDECFGTILREYETMAQPRDTEACQAWNMSTSQR